MRSALPFQKSDKRTYLLLRDYSRKVIDKDQGCSASTPATLSDPALRMQRPGGASEEAITIQSQPLIGVHHGPGAALRY